VYSPSAPTPTPEEWGGRDNPEPANLGYGLAKRIGERLAEILHKETGVATLIVRPFNIFGPWDCFDRKHGHFLPVLLRKMLGNDSEIVLWGGPQTRSFSYVEDIAKHAVELAERVDGCLTVNLSSDQEISIADTAALLARLTGYRGRLLFTDGPIGQMRKVANNSLLKQVLGRVEWKSFESGIQATIDWYRKTRAHEISS
jgi:GDP-L-fucose synthase